MKYAIFDLDNCIADDGWRLRLIDWNEADLDKRYDAYHRACSGDKLGNAGILHEHIRSGHQIVFLTARPVSVSAMTREWIDRVALAGLDAPRVNYTLLMRNNGDQRRSVTIKCEQLVSLQDANAHDMPLSSCVAAYDDRQDVVDMYRANGIDAHVVAIHGDCAMTPPASVEPKGAAAVLHAAARTFTHKNGSYGANYLMIAPMVRILFPDGVPPHLVSQHTWHLFELILVKLSRFATSELQHADSIHDLTVYGAMIEHLLQENQQ